ncbi:DUF2894 domain-containing protein [Trinickia terrae]|uniref:DUF2894 domain-containing protein n=1 Tax=Trinickia terrae TaxID=2571161 RepID=UPI001F0FEF8F|nr:DUF2894 domain-containing protein [Trinickia terrae]
MSSGGAHVRQTLDAWRERGDDRFDPVRFRFIEALERRAVSHIGEARRVLDDKLSKLIEVYAGDLARAASSARDASNGASSREQLARGALAGLVDHIDGAAPRSSSYPELELLDYFRKTWSKFSAAKQLRQSFDQVPRNAGPLNSSSLVHRSLSLMRELSPGYLQQFLSYADALAWLEQMNGGEAAASKEAPRAASAKKSGRSKSR